MQHKAIGIIDSGVGGLSIARAISSLLPHEDLLYVADSKYAPYGDKTSAQIYNRVSSVIDTLKDKNIKALVIACNTATVNLIGRLRQEHAMPIIGVEPGIKPAANNSQSKKIAVLATQSTLKSQAFIDFIAPYQQHNELLLLPCPKFVPLIEAGKIHSTEMANALDECVSPILAQGCDQVVLGCTHYPFLRQQLSAKLTKQITVIDTSAAVAKQTQAVLMQHKLNSDKTRVGKIEFFSSDRTDKASAICSQLWGSPVCVNALS